MKGAVSLLVLLAFAAIPGAVLAQDVLVRDDVRIPFSNGVGAGPRRQQEEAPAAFQPVQQETSTLLAREGGGFLDLDWLELQVRIGLGVFSEDYRIDPSPFIGIATHAPLPWLSPASDPSGEYFGLFLDLSLFPSIERTLDPAPDNNSGMILLLGLGLDFTVIRNQTLYLALQAGVQYAWYGGIEGLQNGFQPLGGLMFGVHLGSGMTLTTALAASFGNAGDSILTASLGLIFEF